MNELRTTHTPGPWHQFDDGGSIENVGRSGRPMNYGVDYSDCVWGPKGPGYGLIADCSPSGQPFSDETRANARLIAAAPELLEALKRLRNEAVIDGLSARPGWDAFIIAADEAISKASVQS